MKPVHNSHTLFTVHSQAQAFQTDNGGGLTGGAAGDERLPSYLTGGTECRGSQNPRMCGARDIYHVLLIKTFYTELNISTAERIKVFVVSLS